MLTQAGGLDAAVGVPGQWISTSNPDLQHWGLKFRVYDLNVPATTTVDAVGALYVEYHVEFRQPK